MKLVPLARLHGVKYQDNWSGDSPIESWQHSAAEQTAICGVFRAGDHIVDVGVYVRPSPDFCGGGLIHSPWVNVRDVTDTCWGYPLPGRNFDATRAQEDWQLGEAFDAADAVDESGLSLREYGYRCLATGLAEYMLHRSWLGCTATGVTDDEEDGSNIQMLADAFEEVTHTTGRVFTVRGYSGSLEWGAVPMRYRTCDQGVSTVNTEVERSRPWFNPNSHHEVQILTFLITSTTYYGAYEYEEYDEDDYDEEYERDYYNDIAEHLECVRNVVAEREQVDYLRAAGHRLEQYAESGLLASLIQRSNWRNG